MKRRHFCQTAVAAMFAISEGTNPLTAQACAGNVNGWPIVVRTYCRAGEFTVSGKIVRHIEPADSLAIKPM